MEIARSVYVEGEGLLTEDGRYFPEPQVKAALAAIDGFCRWYNGLPPMVQAELKRIAQRRKA